MVSLAAPALLVKLKLAGVLTPLWPWPSPCKLPAIVLALNTSDNWPALLVVPAIVIMLSVNVPLAPRPERQTSRWARHHVAE